MESCLGGGCLNESCSGGGGRLIANCGSGGGGCEGILSRICRDVVGGKGLD